MSGIPSRSRTEDPAGNHSWSEGVSFRRMLVAVTIVAGSLVVLGRRPEGLSSPYLAYEDGSRYFLEALVPGIDLFNNYPGYLVILQRLEFLIVGIFPWDVAPQVIYVLGSVTVALTCGVWLQNRFQALFAHAWQPFLLYFLLLLTPMAYEVTNNVVNLQWWLPICVIGMLLAEAPRTRVGTWWENTLIVIFGLSSLTSIFVMPVALGAFLTRRTRVSQTRLILISLTGLVQVGSLLAFRERSRGGLFNLEATIQRLGEILTPVLVAGMALLAVALVVTSLVAIWRGWLTYRALLIVSAVVVSLLALSAATIVRDELASFGSTAAKSFIKKVGGSLLVGDSNLNIFWPLEERLALWAISGLFLIAVWIVGLRWNWTVSLPVLLTGVISAILGLVSMPIGWWLYVGGWGRYFFLAVQTVILILILGLSSQRAGLKLASITLLALTSFSVTSDARLTPFQPINTDEFIRFIECVEADSVPCHLKTAPEGWSIRFPLP